MSQEQANTNEPTQDAAAPAASPLRWYVVHAYSGMEKAVERNLRERIDRAGMQAKFGRILVPTEEVVELKGGKKSVTERRFFPGYVLVEMLMDDESWHLVKHTSKVTGFVGGAKNRPAPISQGGVAGGRTGAGQGRPVHGLQRRHRRRQLRKIQGSRVGHHLRACDARGAGLLPSGEGLGFSTDEELKRASLPSA
jgi:hypothetical protein